MNSISRKAAKLEGRKDSPESLGRGIYINSELALAMLYYFKWGIRLSYMELFLVQRTIIFVAKDVSLKKVQRTET